ncbi:MAG: tol-pal system protein YbgF [Roseibium sp.]|nr:tol-pal system protein YbgF [Roseibium sp.]
MGKMRFLPMVLAALLVLTTAAPSEAQLFGRRNDESAVRVNEMEERLRLLTGQIEQLSFQLREMQEQLRRIQEDNEYRFQQLEGGAPRDRSDVRPSEPGLGSTDLAGSAGTLGTLPAGGSGDGDWAATGGYEQPEPGPGLPGSGPIDLSALAGGLTGPAPTGSGGLDTGTAGVPPQGDQIAGLIGSGDPRTDYDRAYSLAVNGDYRGAEGGFRDFIATYPEHPLVANAQYWLGESLLAQQNYRDAADAFLKTYTDYPNTDKTPDSLLKLGVALRGLGEGDAACATFAELLNKYPGAAPAVLNQARDEQQRARCS